MHRLCALFLSLAVVLMPLYPANAQSSRYRYRMPTQAPGGVQQPAPSFRGGDQTGFDEMQTGMEMRQGASSSGKERRGSGVSQMVKYQVHVLGEVEQPGTYRIPASGRLADAIKMARGLARNGSERRIQLKRGGKVIQTVDLMSFALYGNLADNPYLLENDVVYVPLRDKVVQVVGAVRRPDVYELRGEKHLDQIVKLAGGFNAATAMDEPIRVVRFVNEQKTVKEVPIDEMKRFDIKNGDVVVVSNVVTKDTEFDYNISSIPGNQPFYPSYEDRVFVLGGVSAPGAYPYNPYYTVNQYLSLAGGVSDRGKEKYRIINARGVSRKADENDRINPGETLMVKKRWMTPAAWLGFVLSVASFGLSASATIIALRR